jgi:O-antigen/teichoic acid export membrane protein
MSVESVYSLLTLAFGFAVAGLLATLYQLIAKRPPSFSLLSVRAEPSTVLVVPFLILIAPFIIMRNTIRGVQIENRHFGFVMVATVIAGLWSLASGTLVFKAIATLGLFAA